MIAALLFFSVLFVMPAPRANAITATNLNDSSVFLKQHTSYTCTLTSIAMAMRRTALALGDSVWESVTEESIKSVAWVNGVGLLWSFSIFGMRIGHGDIPYQNRDAFLRDMLNKYPQGVVAYNEGHGGQEHAILMTDYDSTHDVFYAADPANGTASGRIPLTSTSINGRTQEEQISNLDAYWVVLSPTVPASAIQWDSKFIESRTQPENVTRSESTTSRQTPDNTTVNRDLEIERSTFASTSRTVNEYYVVTQQVPGGVAVRNAPTGNGDRVSSLAYQSIQLVKSTGRNVNGSPWVLLNTGNYVYAENLTLFSSYSPQIKAFQSSASNVSQRYMITPTAGDRTAVRLEPSEGNNVCAYLNKGSVVAVSAQGRNTAGAAWLRTSDGYYIRMSEATVTQQPVSISGISRTTVTGAYQATPLADAQSTGSKTATVNASGLNLRDYPTTGNVILVLPRGAKVTVSRTASGWALVSYNGKTGWASMDYLVMDQSSAQWDLGDVNMDGRVTAGDARLALRFSAKMEDLSAAQVKLADFNADGKVQANDARLIMRLSARILVL